MKVLLLKKRGKTVCASLLAGLYISSLFFPVPMMCSTEEIGQSSEQMKTNVTDIFEPVTHDSVAIETLECRVYDDSEFQQLSNKIIRWTDDKSKARAVIEAFNQLQEEYNEASTSQMLAYIRLCENPLDQQIDTIYRENCTVKLKMSNILLQTAQAICNSPCDFAVRLSWTRELYHDIQKEDMLTEEQQQLFAQETQWISKYKEAFQKEYRTDQYDKRNKDIGNLYLNLIADRKQIAESYGYEDYPSYAYENIYEKEYTIEEAATFRADVKTFAVPFLKQLYESIHWNKIEELNKENYDTQYILNILNKYVPRISSEMSEALSYMEENKLYNWDTDMNKMNTNYTTMLVSYHAPYIYRYPVTGFLNLKTTIHEFGHYNACYHVPDEGWGSRSDYDLAEVHSQGLEMLFLDFYSEIFGENGAEAVKYVLYLLMNNLVEGCLYDEFQQYAYTADNITVEALNKEFCRLCIVYGKIPENTKYDEVYSWIEVPHNFESPFYYISYALSAETALHLGMNAVDNRQIAIQKYLMLVKESKEKSYLEILDECGIASPFDNQELQRLVQEVSAYIAGDKQQQPMLYQTPIPDSSVLQKDEFCAATEPAVQKEKNNKWKDISILGAGLLTGMLFISSVLIWLIKRRAKDKRQN